MHDVKCRTWNCTHFSSIVMLYKWQNARLGTLCLVRTALTSSSFVSEHFVKNNDSGNFHYNLADANYTEEKHYAPTITYKTNTTCYTKLQLYELALGNFGASKLCFMPSIFVSSFLSPVFSFKSCIFVSWNFMSGTFMSCNLTSCIFIPCNFDGPSFSRPAFSVAPSTQKSQRSSEVIMFVDITNSPHTLHFN